MIHLDVYIQFKRGHMTEYLHVPPERKGIEALPPQQPKS